MEEYIDQIKKFLRGQMSQEEENAFKKSLMIGVHMRTCAFMIAFLVKTQKAG